MFVITFIISFLASVFLKTYYISHEWYMILIWLLSSFVLASVLCFLMLIVMMPVMKHTKNTNRFKFHFIRSAAVLVTRVFVRLKIKITGREHISKDHNIVLYANHKSYADPLIILKTMNRPVAFTPKVGVYKIPIISNYMNYLGSFPIDRENNRNTAKNMIKAISDVKNGLVMTIFPEGGIKDRDDDSMKEMRAGSYKLAIKSQADILPVTILGNSSIGKRAPLRSTKIQVIIHEAIPYEAYKEMSTSEIAQKVSDIINQDLK